jgi:hypothetical protein
MTFGGLPSLWASRGRILYIGEPNDPKRRLTGEVEVVVSGERGGASLTFLVAPETARDLIAAHERDQKVEIRIVRAPKGKR